MWCGIQWKEFKSVRRQTIENDFDEFKFDANGIADVLHTPRVTHETRT